MRTAAGTSWGMWVSDDYVYSLRNHAAHQWIPTSPTPLWGTSWFKRATKAVNRLYGQVLVGVGPAGEKADTGICKLVTTPWIHLIMLS